MKKKAICPICGKKIDTFAGQKIAVAIAIHKSIVHGFGKYDDEDNRHSMLGRMLDER